MSPASVLAVRGEVTSERFPGDRSLLDYDLPSFCVRINALSAAVYGLIDMTCRRGCLFEIVPIEENCAGYCRGVEHEAGI